MASTASSPDLNAGPLPRSPNAARLARKRATDRRSQRNHRERHRAYVRGLEETIALLRSTSDADERVAVLSAENETLRNRCRALATRLNRIRTIAGENTTRTDIPTQSVSPRTSCNLDTLMGNIGFPSAEVPADLDENLEPLNESSVNRLFANPDDIDVPGQQLEADETTVEDYSDLLGTFPALQEDTALSLVTFEAPFLLENPTPCDFSPPVPEYARPQGSADKLLHAMLEEAIVEHHAGRFDTSKPSLNRLLANGPVDLLSFRLFHYINQYGAMPMHWMLAIFWVQYLYLRVSLLEIYYMCVVLNKNSGMYSETTKRMHLYQTSCAPRRLNVPFHIASPST